MKKFTKSIFLFSLIIFLSSCSSGNEVVIEDFSIQEQKATEKEVENEVRATVEEEIVKSEPEPEPKPLPSTYDTDVLFAPQAPFANWDLPYQEACEEASLIMAYKYFANEDLNKSIMDREIKKLVAWENENLGFYTDTNLEEVAYIAEEYFNLDVEISDEVSEENIKRQLNNGYLIIAPASGRDLDNPNFTEPGPLFHMLIIRGYDRNEFITNDPGTRKGLEFEYKYENLLNSIHDLYREDGQVFRPYEENVSDYEKLRKMRSGAKRMLIVKSLRN